MPAMSRSTSTATTLNHTTGVVPAADSAVKARMPSIEPAMSKA